MPTPATDEHIGIDRDHGRVAALESLVDLAHSQISASLSRAASIDNQALGLVALDAALIAVVVAAQGALGPRGWVAIPGLTLSIVLGGSVLAVTRFDLGPEPEYLYAQVETAVLSGEQVIAKLLADLIDTDKANQSPLRLKATRLLIAVGVLILTAIYTTVVLIL
jgi:hypothetical protein